MNPNKSSKFLSSKRPRLFISSPVNECSEPANYQFNRGHDDFAKGDQFLNATPVSTFNSKPIAATLSEFMNYPSMFRPRSEWCLVEPSPSITTESSASSHEHSHSVLVKPKTLFSTDENTVLHVCIREHRSAAALVLIEYAPLLVNIVNIKGVTPLMLAAQKGDPNLVRLLLLQGANPTTQSPQGNTAALQASHFGHLSVLEVLSQFSDSSFSILNETNVRETTPLMRASQEGHTEVVIFLLEKCGKHIVNEVNLHKMNALMLASQRGHAEICRILISAGTKLNQQTTSEATALMLACKRAHVEVVRVLVEAGCDLYYRNSRGRSAYGLIDKNKLESNELESTRSQLRYYFEPPVQVHLMQCVARRKRNWTVCRLWHLLQQERALCQIIPPCFDDFNLKNKFSSNGWSIHDDKKLEFCQQQILASEHRLSEQHNSPQCQGGIKFVRQSSYSSSLSERALWRMMTLPFPIFQLITEFVELPPLWTSRLGYIENTCVVDPNAAVTLCFDLLDEVLERGGYLEACLDSHAQPPEGFENWREWKRCLVSCCSTRTWCSSEEQPVLHQIVTTATVPCPPEYQSTMLELRRKAGYLVVLARDLNLQFVLQGPSYCMPKDLVQQIVTVSDLCLLARRMRIENYSYSSGITFDATVALDLHTLARSACRWYWTHRM